jgi:hypothetical protein
MLYVVRQVDRHPPGVKAHAGEATKSQMSYTVRRCALVCRLFNGSM